MTVEWRRFLPAFLIAAVVLAYANTLTTPFIFDDYNAIVDNPNIRQLWPPVYLIQAPDQSTVAGRPIVGLTLAINYAISGLHPWSYHVVNLAFHAGCVLLLFGIVRRTLKNDGLAFAIAVVWAVHPLLTESVTYVIQRTELMMAFFLLLTLYCVIRGWRIGAVIACAAGMLCKEVMGVAPVLVLLYDRTFLAGSFREAWRQRRRLYLALAATWLVLAVIIASSPRGETVGWSHPDITPWQYFLTQCGVILHYLKLSVWPHPLTLDYDDWPMATQWTKVWLSVLLLAALARAVWWALRHRPAIGFLGAWFFLILAPTSSIIPIISEVVAERRMYLPLMAVMILIVVGLNRFLKSPAKIWLLALVIVALTGLTLRRNWDYRTEEAFWRDAVAKRPANVRSYANLATVLFKQGRPIEACAVAAQALAINPHNPEAQFNIGLFLAGHDRFVEALPPLRRAVELAPLSSAAQYNLALDLTRLQHYAEAEKVLLEALRLEPRSSIAHKQMGAVLALQDRPTEAIPHFEEALRREPNDNEARALLAEARTQLSRTNSPPPKSQIEK